MGSGNGRFPFGAKRAAFLKRRDHIGGAADEFMRVKQIGACVREAVGVLVPVVDDLGQEVRVLVEAEEDGRVEAVILVEAAGIALRVEADAVFVQERAAIQLGEHMNAVFAVGDETRVEPFALHARERAARHVTGFAREQNAEKARKREGIGERVVRIDEGDEIVARLIQRQLARIAGETVWRVDAQQPDVKQRGKCGEDIVVALVGRVVHNRHVHVVRDGLHGDARQRARQRGARIVNRDDGVDARIAAQRLVHHAVGRHGNGDEHGGYLPAESLVPVISLVQF